MKKIYQNIFDKHVIFEMIEETSEKNSLPRESFNKQVSKLKEIILLKLITFKFNFYFVLFCKYVKKQCRYIALISTEKIRLT